MSKTNDPLISGHQISKTNDPLISGHQMSKTNDPLILGHSDRQVHEPRERRSDAQLRVLRRHLGRFDSKLFRSKRKTRRRKSSRRRRKGTFWAMQFVEVVATISAPNLKWKSQEIDFIVFLD
jgi:hypothetical protein